MKQVLRAGALGRPRGMGWGGRWEGGSGWGTHVNPWLIHVNVWQKPLQYCKVINLQQIKINGKKNVFVVKDNRIPQVDEFSTFLYMGMYGKLQEPGLTEVISLVHTSTIWGQNPVFTP